ncbi:hypothetical protein D3C71_868110 [compost metagenome]
MIVAVKVGLGFKPSTNRLAGETIISDSFNRANSVSTVGTADTGQPWVPSSGSTWGISGGQIYCSSDVNVDSITMETSMRNYQISARLSSYSNKRYMNLIFHYYNDTTYLLARVLNGNAEIYKLESGASILASAPVPVVDGQPYTLTVRCYGTNIVVNVDGVDYINYYLFGADSTKFPPYTRVGLRLSKTGTPTVPTLAGNFVVKKL